MSWAANESRKRTARGSLASVRSVAMVSSGWRSSRGDRKPLVGVTEMPAVSGHELQSLFGNSIGDAQHPREVAAGTVFHHLAKLRSRHRRQPGETTPRGPA